MAGMNYFASQRTLKTIEEHLRASIEHKGSGLVSNQALGLRDLVMDNAFGDVSRLVERTLEKDEQLVYGLFLDEQQKAWASPRGKVRPRAQTIGTAQHHVKATERPGCRSSIGARWGRTSLSFRWRLSTTRAGFGHGLLRHVGRAVAAGLE